MAEGRNESRIRLERYDMVSSQKVMVYVCHVGNRLIKLHCDHITCYCIMVTVTLHMATVA